MSDGACTCPHDGTDPNCVAADCQSLRRETRDLAERLRSALDEHEKAAKRAAGMRYDLPSDAPWESARIYVERGVPGSYLPLQALCNPTHVLRTVAAHREILRLHESINVWPEGTEGAKFYTGSKRVCSSCDERTDTPCPTVRALASIYFPDEDD